MAAAVEQAMIRVKVRQGFSAPTWSCERGDEIDVPLADARRMVTRGLAGPPEKTDTEEGKAAKAAYDRAMKMTPREHEEAREVSVEDDVSEVVQTRLGLQGPVATKNTKKHQTASVEA